MKIPTLLVSSARQHLSKAGLFSHAGLLVTYALAAFAGLLVVAGIYLWNLNYNSAFNDEAIYIVLGKIGLFTWDWSSYNAGAWMAGLPYLYPPLTALGYTAMGIVGSRFINVVFGIFVLREVYRLASSFTIYNRNHAHLAGLIAALVAGFSAVGLYTTRLATYDIPAFFLLLVSINLIIHASVRNYERNYFLAAFMICLSIAIKIITAAFLPLLLALSFFYARSASSRDLWISYFVMPLGLGLMLIAFINFGGIMTYLTGQTHREYIPIATLLKALWDYNAVVIAFGTLATACSFIWGNRWYTLFIVSAALILPIIHIAAHRLATFDKHSYLFVIFMAILIGHLAAALLHMRYAHIITALFLIVGIPFYASGEIQKMHAMEQAWSNLYETHDHLVHFVHPRDRILTEEGASTILALYGTVPPHNITTFDWMQYHSLTGNEAYQAAIKDGYFNYILLSNKELMYGDLSTLVRPLLETHYELIDITQTSKLYERR